MADKIGQFKGPKCELSHIRGTQQKETHLCFSFPFRRINCWLTVNIPPQKINNKIKILNCPTEVHQGGTHIYRQIATSVDLNLRVAPMRRFSASSYAFIPPMPHDNSIHPRLI